jgi:hypothetical protein
MTSFKSTLPDGTEYELSYFDMAGPYSRLRLNTTSLFVRFNDEGWLRVEETKSMHKAKEWLEICKDIKDAKEILWVIGDDDY